ncbi:MAG: MlaD family protein [Thermaurantiacus tibetensis]|uniref:MlaD family protein n=1 Tax=Thermaurantiacus tibetensis TaxID=2759035 RepID=UPI00189016A5|nr:MlaD family protein [Thermaurantiacus tibetensis]
METERSTVIVGAVTLALVVALFAFILWLSNYSTGGQRQYDLFFRQSVAGLSVGSTVSFSGVPVGQVERIALMPESPEFIRVRISVGEDVPVLEGTTAVLQASGFTGVSVIQLQGAIRGAPPITQPGPFGVPVIPTRPSGFGQILETAPEVVERASVLVARLNEVLSDENRENFARILENLDRTSTEVAKEAPRLGATLEEARNSLRSAGLAAERVAALSDATAKLVSADGQAALAELRNAARATNAAAARLDRVLAAAEPGVATLASDTVPELNRLLAELRGTAASLDALADRAAGDPQSFLAGRPLPDYQPKGP